MVSKYRKLFQRTPLQNNNNNNNKRHTLNRGRTSITFLGGQTGVCSVCSHCRSVPTGGVSLHGHSRTWEQAPAPAGRPQGGRAVRKPDRQAPSEMGLSLLTFTFHFTMHEALLYTLCYLILKIQPQSFLHSTGTLEADADKKWQITRSLGLVTLEWELSCTLSVPNFVSDCQ